MNHKTLSDSQLAGQRLMAGFDGTVFNDDLKRLIDTLNVGGLILFAPNIESPDQIAALCGAAREYAAACGLPPLFIAIDQEGGEVARLGPPFTQFPGNPYLTDEASVDQFAETTAAELRQIGVNMNLVPVLDVAGPTADSIMKNRAFPGGPENVARLGGRMIRQFQRHGIMAVAKHFPGIGRTTSDSHLDQPDLDVDPDLLAASDLVPFRTAIQQNVAGIMLSHIRYTRIDPKHPASLSAPVARTLLRDTLGFDGLVMTDDLDMGAIRKHYAVDTAIGLLTEAEVDLALVCHAGPAVNQAHETLLRLATASEGGRAAAEKAADRILQCKKRFLYQDFPKNHHR